LAGGVLFFGNMSFSVLAYKYLEGSIVSMLHQLNAVWLFLFGVFVFKEIDFKKYWLRLVVGLVFSIIGLLMLILARYNRSSFQEKKQSV
jgi:drug/metabolite transporter (DMT)-like permease